jgi:riboflavin kinase/FMN adenylyltransferase
LPQDSIIIEVLGSGTSVGVPSIACDCAVCSSTDPRDSRLRPSVLLRYRGRNILIDCGPDFRQQVLRAGVKRLDAILLTHAHADHIMGLDDVRPFNFRQGGPIPVYGSQETIATVRQVFRYIFETVRTESTLPRIETHVIGDEPFELHDLTFTPIPAAHGRGTTFGYQFGSAAYLTDHNVIPESSLQRLEGLDVLFLDGLRHREHPTHSTVKQALAYVDRLRPRRGYLTHICHDLGHAETEITLPPRVALAQDGMRVEVSAAPPARWLPVSETAGRLPPRALTIGNFDGVHRGHRELMRMAVAKAELEGWRAAVVTFDPHPARLVAPERAPRLLTRPEERAPLMAEEGINDVHVVEFTPAIAALGPENFVRQILVDRLNARYIVVGEDFRFGAKQSGDATMLAALGRRLGFEVDAIRKVDSHHHHISSSAIRRALSDGAVGEAGRMLGAPFALEGEVVKGLGVGSKQTVPTLNLAWTAEVIPGRGVYVTRTRELHTCRTWPSITNIGFRPTFGGESLTIETFLLEPLAGPAPRAIRVEFFHRLRDERQFPDAAELKAQILRDVGRAQAFHRRAARWVGSRPVDTLEVSI